LIDVARIDYWAASGSGPFQRASIVSKIIFLLLVLAAALMAKSPYSLGLGYLFLLSISAAARLPWFRMLALSLYAAVFTVLYLISLRGSILAHAVLIVKSITPALAVLMLIVSTPYPRIFSLLSAVLPEILAAGLFMTYRTLFILLDMMGDFVVAIRLRGGFSPGSLYKNAANISKGIGMLLVRAVERSSRLYAVMAVRGYNGSMAEKGSLKLHREDWLPLGTGTAILVLVMFWR
jgi:cobalt/nickel transport system permease protein